MVHRHVVPLGTVLQGQGHGHPRLLVQDGELVPAVVAEQGDHGFGRLLRVNGCSSGKVGDLFYRV